MIDVRDIKLIDEIPGNIKRDKKVIALAKSLDRSLEAPSKMIDRINYEMDLKNQDESVIDHLLWENNIGQYEGLMFVRNKQEKINLLESAIELKRTKGTPYSIEKVLEVMGMKGYVEEWFQYDSLPFHFLVELEIANDFREIKDVRKLVLHYKNTRSWFDGFVILIAPGGFIIFDDSYSYPVFYKDCGWFSGEKCFSQYTLPAINLINDTYDYYVLYPYSERYISYIDMGVTEIINDDYSYIKKFEYTGDLELLLKKVDTQAESFYWRNENYNYNVFHKVNENRSAIVEGGKVRLREMDYSYPKEFPIASDVEPAIQKINLQSNALSYKEDSYNIASKYPTCGDFYTGE